MFSSIFGDLEEAEAWRGVAVRVDHDVPGAGDGQVLASLVAAWVARCNIYYVSQMFEYLGCHTCPRTACPRSCSPPPGKTPRCRSPGSKKVGNVSNQIVGMSGQCCLVQTFSMCEPVRWTQRCKNTRLQILPRASSCLRGPSTLPTSRHGCPLEG